MNDKQGSASVVNPSTDFAAADHRMSSPGGTVSRRMFSAASLHVLLLPGLFQRAARADALGGSLKWSARPWLNRLDEASRALSFGTLDPQGWQQAVEEVLAPVELGDILNSLDFERLANHARFPTIGEGMQRLYFLEDDGKLHALTFRPFLFTLKQGTAVVPHGHHNMSTMHMILQGRARVRHFDRIESTPTHMLIRAASEVVGGPGQVTSVSDDHQNIHWFEPMSERVFMFNIGVYQVRPGPFGERDYVDPLGGVPLGNGLVRAPRLDRQSAFAKYGHT